MHTEKDHITAEMKDVIETLYAAVVAHIGSPHSREAHAPAMAFVYMSELGEELALFLEQHGLDPTLARDEEIWTEFVALLVKVLESQPINNPIENIEKFIFEPANQKCVVGTLIFKQPIAGKHFYRFLNTY